MNSILYKSHTISFIHYGDTMQVCIATLGYLHVFPVSHLASAIESAKARIDESLKES